MLNLLVACTINCLAANVEQPVVLSDAPLYGDYLPDFPKEFSEFSEYPLPTVKKVYIDRIQPQSEKETCK